MRRIILIFSLIGFAMGALVGILGQSNDGSRAAVASTGEPVPTFYLSGIDGAAQNVSDTIQGAVRHRLATGGALLADRASDCTIDLGANFDHEMADTHVIVTLHWFVRTAGGNEIARVKMKNIVPAAMLNGDWSGDAPHIARTVEEALIRIIADKPVPIC